MTTPLGRLVPVALCCVATVASAQQVRFERRALAHDTVVAAIPCAATGRLRAEFFPGGALHECPLARAFSVGGHLFPRGTWVILAGDGRLDGAWLSETTVLQGIRCRGTGFQGWSVRFHAQGQLASCYLAEVATIDGVPCLNGTFWNEIRGGTRTGVVLDVEGRLVRCQIAYSVTIAGRRYAKWAVFARGSRP